MPIGASAIGIAIFSPSTEVLVSRLEISTSTRCRSLIRSRSARVPERLLRVGACLCIAEERTRHPTLRFDSKILDAGHGLHDPAPPTDDSGSPDRAADQM